MQALDVLMLDPGARAVVRGAEVRVVERVEELDPGAPLFVFARASAMPEVAGRLRGPLRAHRGPVALLVRQDVGPTLLLEWAAETRLAKLGQVLVHRGSQVLLRRILAAWRRGTQDRAIACAEVTGDTLHLRSCALERFSFGFAAADALAAIPEGERASFEVAGQGASIRWPGADVQTDLDALRKATDSRYRYQALIDAVTRGPDFGPAVATVREEHGLRQIDIKRISSRHVRRIEHGDVPRIATLKKLAAAHGLDLDAYLREVAAAAEGLRAAREAE